MFKGPGDTAHAGCLSVRAPLLAIRTGLLMAGSCLFIKGKQSRTEDMFSGITRLANR